MRRKRHLSQQDLRALGAAPGRMFVRYTPGGERAEVRQVVWDRKNFAPPIKHSFAKEEGEEPSS